MKKSRRENAKKILRRTGIWILIFVFMVGYSAVRRQKDTEEASGITIGLLVSTPSNDFMRALQDGAEAAARKHGAQLYVETAYNLEIQLSQVRSVLARGVDALVIWPYDGDAVASVIEEANEQNVPVFTFDVKAKGCDVTGQISTDNHMIGETAAHTMAGFLYQKNGAYQGKIALLSGPFRMTSHQDRVEAFMQVMETEYPEIQILVQKRMEGSEKVIDVVSTWAGMYGGQLDGIYCASDYLTASVLTALRQKNQLFPVGDPDHLILLGTDAFPAVVEAIRENLVDGVVAQNAVQIGREAMEAAWEYLEEGQLPEKQRYIPLMVITTENIDSEEVKEFGIWSDEYRKEAKDGE